MTPPTFRCDTGITVGHTRRFDSELYNAAYIGRIIFIGGYIRLSHRLDPTQYRPTLYVY